jgi:uncharacterized protein (TIGR02145 family)
VVVLTKHTPDYTITTGGDVRIFGTGAANHITVESGGRGELVNFPGFNTVQFQSSVDGFTVSRSGLVVTFQGTDGTVLKIPATPSVQTIVFSDLPALTLSVYKNLVVLDDQVVTPFAADVGKGLDGSVSGKIHRDLFRNAAVVNLSKLESSESLGTYLANEKGEWTIPLNRLNLHAGELLLITGTDVETGFAVHSLINASDVLKTDHFSSNATVLSHYTEAAWQLADSQDISNQDLFILNAVRLSDLGNPVKTGNNKINVLADWVLSYFISSGNDGVTDYQAALLAKIIETLWPYAFMADTVTHIGLPDHLLAAGYGVSVGGVTTADSITRSDGGIRIVAFSATGETPGEVEVVITGQQAQQILALPFHVFQPQNSTEKMVMPGGTDTIALGALAVQTEASTFREPTRLTVYELDTRDISRFVSYTIFAAFELQAGTELESPVTLYVTLDEGQDPDKIFILHFLSSTGEAEYIYPDEYDPDTGKLRFTLDSFSQVAVAEDDGDYDLGTTFDLEKMKANPKEVFSYLDRLIDFLGDNNLDKIRTDEDINAEFAAHLVSEALHSFIETAQTGTVGNELENIDFRAWRGIIYKKWNAADVFQETCNELFEALSNINRYARSTSFELEGPGSPIMAYLDEGNDWAIDMNMWAVDAIAGVSDYLVHACYFSPLSYHLMGLLSENMNEIVSLVFKAREQGFTDTQITAQLKQLRAIWMSSSPVYVNALDDLTFFVDHLNDEVTGAVESLTESFYIDMLPGNIGNIVGTVQNIQNYKDTLTGLKNAVQEASYVVDSYLFAGSPHLWEKVTLSMYDDTEAEIEVYILKTFYDRLKSLDNYIENLPDCTYDISPTNDDYEADGGSKSVSVSTPSSSCAWSASSNVSWASVSYTNDTGNGSVTVQVDPNTGDARSGTVTIAGKTYTINQDAGTCTYGISPTKDDYVSRGEIKSVSVTTSYSSCTWSVSSNVPWASVSPTHGTTGNGSVEVRADSNPSDARTGTVTIAGETYTINQDARPCIYEISPITWSFGSDAESKTVTVTTSYSSCTWSASSSVPWASLSPTNDSGNGSVTVQVEPNTGNTRSGTVTIAGRTYTINQAGKNLVSSCGAYIAPGVWKEFDCYNLAAVGKTTNDDPFTPSWRLIGGYWQWGRKGPDPSQWYDNNSEHFAHGPDGPDANEANSAEISGWSSNSADNGAWRDSNGNKTDNDPCPTGFRLPTIDEWDAVRNDTVNNPQRSEGSWSTTSDDHTNYGNARFFGEKLMLPAAGRRNSSTGALLERGSYGIYWSSSEYDNYSAWNLYFNSGNAYTGYNTGYRTTGLSVRCVADSEDPPCTYDISTTNSSFASDGGSKTVTVTTSSSSCAWSASSNVAWASVSPANATGNGSVIVQVDLNTGDTRSGAVTIAGRTYTINQDAAACTYDISPTSGDYASGGGSKTVSVTTSSSSCAWSASSNVTWASVSPANATGNGSVTVQVDPNTGDTRSGTVTIAGKTYTINQARDEAVHFDETIIVTDLSTYDAGDGDYLYKFPDTVSGIKIITIINFSFGDAIQVEEGNEITSIEAYCEVSCDHIDIILGIPGNNSWSIHVSGLDGSLVYDLSEATTFEERLQILEAHWGSDFYSVTGGVGGGNSCGAYIASGVWKEFDCYNLAAIGKTTNDDPFTPSWRLIGGYWQWGRKGPDPSQWYDTNTSNFAHGPTGPNAEDANASPVGENVEVTVNAGTASSGALDASGADYTFIISGDASYNQEITGFDVGDVLVFPEENLPTLNNVDFSDGIVEIQYAFAPFVSIVQLTGLDTAIDQQLLGMTSFDRVFGDTGATIEWDSSYAPDGAWSDSSKTANDPCPDGYRLPTTTQWDGVLNNNTQSTFGSWSISATNYSSARFFGSDLMLPAAGYRSSTSGELRYRGSIGSYWSNAEDGGYGGARNLYFSSSSADRRTNDRGGGLSVRCISE